jgi:hypothetical protein
MSSRVALLPQGEQTLLRYTAQAEIGGKLASVGSRLVQAVARKNADDFFAAFTRQLGGAPAAAPEAALQPAAPGSLRRPGPRPGGCPPAAASVRRCRPGWSCSPPAWAWPWATALPC